mgnify:CR=1 FL=1|tara:strand:- start:4512 stop:5780 length:1269 start_codon:yes stop_codon:yes gene_type:complete
MISDYFKTMKTEYDANVLNKFGTEKCVRQEQVQQGDRTVCQMLRNVNVLTGCEYELQITSLIKYINDAVLMLREYKTDFDKNWWDNKGDISFSRSTFDPHYLQMSKELLSLDHPLFNDLSRLYNHVDDPNTKNFVLESVYYTYKINLKLSEYETILKPLNSAGKNYTNQWTNILQALKSADMRQYDPYLLTFLELRRRLETKPQCIKDGALVPLRTLEEFKLAFDYSRRPVYDLIKDNEYDTVIELGSGFGRNMFYYLSLLGGLNSSIVMGEYTLGGLEAANYIKRKYFGQRKVQIYNFDYNSPQLFFEQLKLSRKMSKVLVTTFWSIEQIANIKPELMECILGISPSVTCVHLEPVGSQVSDKSVMLTDVQDFRSYYNKNLYKTLKGYEERGKLQIADVKLDYFNFGDPGSCGTLIKWKKV